MKRRGAVPVAKARRAQRRVGGGRVSKGKGGMKAMMLRKVVGSGWTDRWYSRGRGRGRGRGMGYGMQEMAPQCRKGEGERADAMLAV